MLYKSCPLFIGRLYIYSKCNSNTQLSLTSETAITWKQSKMQRRMTLTIISGIIGGITCIITFSDLYVPFTVFVASLHEHWGTRSYIHLHKD